MFAGVDLFPLQRHVALKLVPGEDAAGQRHVMVLLRFLQRLAQAAAEGGDGGQSFGRRCWGRRWCEGALSCTPLQHPGPSRYPSRKPTVFRHEGFRFFFYSNEGNPREPAHVHATRDGHEAKFWPRPEVALADSRGFDARTLRALAGLVEAKRNLIEEAWHEYFG